MKRPTARTVIVVTLIMLALTACGLPAEDDVRVVDPEDVPFGLLESSSGSPDTTSPAPSPLTDSFSAYFVHTGLLTAVPVERELPILPETAIRVLLAGPDADAVKLGLRTALVGDRLIRTVTVSGGTALVDLDVDFALLAPREQLLALGQIVLTLTTLRGVGSVDVRVLGKVAEIRVGDGSLEPGPVTRDDYQTLLEPR